jgi:hypothetical protein
VWIGKPCLECPWIKLAVDRSQASFDIAQTLAVGQLSKCQAKELIETGKATEFIVSTVPIDALVELVGWDVIDQLRENDAAEMHASACRMLQHRPSTGENAPKPSTEVEIEKSQNTLHATEQTGPTQGSKCDSRTAVFEMVARMDCRRYFHYFFRGSSTLRQTRILKSRGRMRRQNEPAGAGDAAREQRRARME